MAAVRGCLLLALWAALGAGPGHAWVFRYENLEVGATGLDRRVPMFSPSPSVGEDEAFIEVTQLVVAANLSGTNGVDRPLAELFIIPESTWERPPFEGSPPDCANVAATRASRGFLYVQAELSNANQIDGLGRARLDTKFSVVETGYHRLFVLSCQSERLTIESGIIKWRNPYGFLPGNLYGYLPFYSYMALLFLLASLVWFALSAAWWREIIAVQYAISAVLFLCLVEMTTWHFVWNRMNRVGKFDSAGYFAGAFFSVARRALARMLVIAISMGYGVVRATLGDERTNVLVLGGTYFLFGMVLEIVASYDTDEDLLKLLCFAPVALLDAFTYWWIFVALSALLAQLRARGQLVKQLLYRKFAIVLALSFVCALGIEIYSVYFKQTNQDERHWSLQWLLEQGAWQILFAALMIAIMVLWRPDKNSQRYAYSRVAVDEPEEELQELSAPKAGDLPPEASEPAARNGPVRPSDLTAVFAIGDEEEEQGILYAPPAGKEI